MVLTLAPLPWLRGAAICLPAWLSSQSDQSGHQLPGCSVAPSSHWARLAGSLPSARIQWLRLRWAGGLMTPAIWPPAPLPKRLFARQHLGAGVGRIDRHDMVFARTVDVHRQLEPAQVHLLPAHRELVRLD